MNWHDLWNYFGNFDDREFFRMMVIVAFLFGIPVTVGLLAKVVGWSVNQVRRCHAVIHNPAALQADKTGYPVG